MPHTSIARRYGSFDTIVTAFAPYRLKMRAARCTDAPCAWRNTITSRIARCSVHATASWSALTAPSPDTSRRRCGCSSSTFSVSSLKCCTIRNAVTWPMPLIMPEPRYFSIPASVVGASSDTLVARSCSPWMRSTSMIPRARMREPAETRGNVPMTVSRSLRPGMLTFTIRKPVSTFSNVTSATSPSIATSFDSVTTSLRAV